MKFILQISYYIKFIKVDYSGITIGLNVLFPLICGLAGALGVWFKLKGTVNIQRMEIINLQDDNKLTHQRINSVKDTVEKNREKQDSLIQDLKSEMTQMEIRIINAIHDIKKNEE